MLAAEPFPGVCHIRRASVALAPDGSVRICAINGHTDGGLTEFLWSGCCQDMQDYCCLSHVLPAAHGWRHVLPHAGSAAEEVTKLVMTPAVDYR
jgi:hypothetical protein